MILAGSGLVYIAGTVNSYGLLNKCIAVGFIMMLVKELWGILEGGAGDYRLTAPRAHPLDPMDRASHKVQRLHSHTNIHMHVMYSCVILCRQ